MERDLTEGKCIPQMVNFMIPSLIGYLVQECYTAVDTIVVGRTLGVKPLAAVGSTGPLCFLFLGFCIGMTGGFTVPVAQKFGAKDYPAMRSYTVNGSFLTFISSLILAFFTVHYSRALLMMMKTPADIIDDSTLYMRVLFTGIPFVIAYNFSSAILMALGDSRSPLKFLLLSSVMNIVLDLLFVITFRLGIAGVALATVISEGTAGILCILYIRKNFPILKSSAAERKIRWDRIKTLTYNGLPMGVQYSITALGVIVLQGAVNTLGSIAVAGMTAGSRISWIFSSLFDSMGLTVNTFTGQNTGARKPERIKEGVKGAIAIGFIYSACSLVLIHFLAEPMLSVFIKDNSTRVLEYGSLVLKYNGYFYFALTLVIVLRFALQGMGYAPLAVMSGVFEMVARIAVALLLVPRLGFFGTVVANPAAWIAADLFLIPAFIICFRRTERRISCR